MTPRTPTNTSCQRVVVVKTGTGVQHGSHTLLWYIVLVTVLFCCVFVSFVCSRKKAKASAALTVNAQPDLEASQASSSPLMFKGNEGRDLSLATGS